MSEQPEADRPHVPDGADGYWDWTARRARAARRLDPARASPARVMVDNCKTAVLSHPLGQPAVFNPRYLDFASHHGFEIRACGVRQAHEKGRVENAVKFIKENF